MRAMSEAVAVLLRQATEAVVMIVDGLRERRARRLGRG